MDSTLIQIQKFENLLRERPINIKSGSRVFGKNQMDLIKAVEVTQRTRLTDAEKNIRQPLRRFTSALRSSLIKIFDCLSQSIVKLLNELFEKSINCSFEAQHIKLGILYWHCKKIAVESISSGSILKQISHQQLKYQIGSILRMSINKQLEKVKSLQTFSQGKSNLSMKKKQQYHEIERRASRFQEQQEKFQKLVNQIKRNGITWSEARAF